DLARTNETLASLAETVRTSLQINPDVLAIFVGNNWNLLETPEVSPYAPSIPARREIAKALRTEGVAGPIRLAAERLRERAEAALEQIAFIARTVQIPVVLVLPEVNLADWETRQPPVWLPGDGNARWHDLYKDAVDAMERLDFAAAGEAARAMLELDGGACASTWRLLALASEGLGNPEEARRAALAEVDSATYATLAFLGAPQATTAAREIQRDAVRRHGFTAVDLRAVFREHTGEILPGRRMFLDYCHLTTEGIHVAMAAVAAEVLNLSGMLETDVDWRTLLLRLPAPVLAAEAEATTRLGAAIHSAHRLLSVGRKGPILEHWLAAALEASPGIEAAMLDVAEARCAPGPAVLTAALRRNFASPYRLLLQHGWRWDFLDADLMEAIQAVLERRGQPVRERIAQLLLQHRTVGEEGTDLAEPPYLWEPLERFFPEVMRFEDLAERATVRSPWPTSSFCLISAGEKDIQIEPTLRLPAVNGSRSGRVEIEINGVETGGMDAADRWRRETLWIGRELLRPGLNRLTLRWPAPGEEGAAALRTAVRRLEQGLAADLHPVFGEVFSLIVHTA
ncbi:MAG TPA: hypothetical protein VGQ28_05650, partial [Thermoanaerobaculia bacterium]|nr:hypothetical protein [Thermoanaerobaculia bacterium]